MKGLRAAHLNQQVVVTGGNDEHDNRDEVLYEKLVMRDLACLQVLQYNPSDSSWTQIGSLKRGRAYHAITEVNLAALGCVGNLNPIIQ